MAKKDYYDLLGVDKTASKEDIKKAYKRLAKKFHPDLNKEDPNTTEKFKEINEAAAVLADDQKRANYDQFGTTADQMGAGAGGFDFSDFADSSGDFDFDSIFDSFFSGGFNNFRQRSRRGGQRRGSDLRFDMEIDLTEAAKGTKKTIKIPKLVSCKKCDGKGAVDDSDIVTCSDCGGNGVVRRTQRTPFGIFQTQGPCSRCHGEGKRIKSPCEDCEGTGRVEDEKQIEIRIPAGVDNGTRLRLAGEGEAGERKGHSGDLYVIIHVREHDLFERHGDDLYLEVPISFSQAALGDNIEVPTLDGKVSLKIPEGTSTGTIFRLKGKGILHLNGSGEGNELVKVLISTPTNLSKKQKELLKEFAKESGEDAKPSEGLFKRFFKGFN